MNSFKKERLIDMKLIGSLDSYELLKNEPEFKNMTIDEIKQIGNTIKTIVIKQLELNENEFKEFELENQEIQYVKSRWNEDREKGFLTIRNFIKWLFFKTKLIKKKKR